MKVNEHLSILFFLSKKKASKDGKAPIWARITVDGERAEFSLGRKIFPDFWDQERENVNVSVHPEKKEAMQLSSEISQILTDLNTHYFFLSQHYERVSADLLKRSYSGELVKEQSTPPPPERTLLQALNYKYSKLAQLVKVDERSPNTLKRWKVTKNKLRAFLHFTFHKWDISLSQVRSSLCDDFLQFLLVQHGIKKNTAMKYLKNTKELLTIADRKEWLNKNPWAGFKTTYKQPPRLCLTMPEIIRLSRKSFIPRLDHVRNVFLFACFTGYAFQEVQDLRRDMIFIGNDGKRWIKIDRLKTGNPECLPLLPIPAAIVDMYVDDPYCIANNCLLPVRSYQHYNGYLKEVGDICEIGVTLSTHVARHTFATTVCLDNGIPLETVSRMLGHTNIRTTQIYARVSNRNISVNMSDLEKKLFTVKGELKVVEMQHLLSQWEDPAIAV
ncbi:site-specific integrase [Chitinophaga cymbidii]|uniref:Transposase n=1 Tax=Chitinophaga cymbidii TaxID=1096750 RepID=A0A512RSB6_9BACT|nr:site-specific integrase [Chitinophaga cymbidii]GEP98587.1 transposase [Chitinophaga cymbidii]